MSYTATTEDGHTIHVMEEGVWCEECDGQHRPEPEQP